MGTDEPLLTASLKAAALSEVKKLRNAASHGSDIE